MIRIKGFMLIVLGLLLQAFYLHAAAPVVVKPPKRYAIYTNRTSSTEFQCEYDRNYSVIDFQIIKKHNLKIERIAVNTHINVDSSSAHRIERNFIVYYRAASRGKAAIEEVNIVYSTPAGDTDVIKLYKPIIGRARWHIPFWIYVLVVLGFGVLVFVFWRRKHLYKTAEEELKAESAEQDEKTILEKYIVDGAAQQLYDYIYRRTLALFSTGLQLTYTPNYRELLIELDRHSLEEEKNFLQTLREIIFSRDYGDRFKQRHFARKFLEFVQRYSNKKEKEGKDEHSGDK